MYRALDGQRFEFACAYNTATTHSDFYQSLKASTCMWCAQMYICRANINIATFNDEYYCCRALSAGIDKAYIYAAHRVFQASLVSIV